MISPTLNRLLHRAKHGWDEALEQGQGLVEYALILVLVVLVAFVVMVWIGPWIGNVFSNVLHTL